MSFFFLFTFFGRTVHSIIRLPAGDVADDGGDKTEQNTCFLSVYACKQYYFMVSSER